MSHRMPSATSGQPLTDALARANSDDAGQRYQVGVDGGQMPWRARDGRGTAAHASSRKRSSVRIDAAAMVARRPRCPPSISEQTKCESSIKYLSIEHEHGHGGSGKAQTMIEDEQVSITGARPIAATSTPEASASWPSVGPVWLCAYSKLTGNGRLEHGLQRVRPWCSCRDGHVAARNHTLRQEHFVPSRMMTILP